MTTAIVYSKNRACQLDLLLRSIEANAPDLYGSIHVIWKAEGEYEYAPAYRQCAHEHPEAIFTREHDLRDQTIYLASRAADEIAFLMDDCVFYRKMVDDPAEVLEDEDVLCFSPRLGLNTTRCYPLRCEQQLPELVYHAPDDMIWDWTDADCDFGYPASLDGHIFRQSDLLPLLHVVQDWRTPNTVEQTLAGLVVNLNRPLMAAHTVSSLVGVAVNRTSETNTGNRAAELYAHDLLELNREYLAGKRIRLDSVAPESVDAAHIETELRFA